MPQVTSSGKHFGFMIVTAGNKIGLNMFPAWGTWGGKQVYRVIICPNILGELKDTVSLWSHGYFRTLTCGRT